MSGVVAHPHYWKRCDRFKVVAASPEAAESGPRLPRVSGSSVAGVVAVPGPSEQGPTALVMKSMS